MDGICDEDDDCIGEYDECGECNGPGLVYECWNGDYVCDLQQCEDDPNNECDSQVCLSLNGGNLNYISNDDILGFQFNHMNCAVNAFGGYVEDNGFLLNTNENMLVALTLSGDVIPAGNGILLEGIECEDGYQLSNFIFSTYDGMPLTVEGPPCNDYDTDGVCDFEDECVGNYDECGVCNGDGVDECGTCDGSVVDLGLWLR